MQHSRSQLLADFRRYLLFPRTWPPYSLSFIPSAPNAAKLQGRDKPEREIQHMLQRVNNIQYTLHGAREALSWLGDSGVQRAIDKTNSMQQILKHLDKVQHSLYSLTPLALRQGVVPDQIESISRCQHGQASHRAPARADYARKALCVRGRKSKSEPAKVASLDPGKYRGYVFSVFARIGQAL